MPRPELNENAKQAVREIIEAAAPLLLLFDKCDRTQIIREALPGIKQRVAAHFPDNSDRDKRAVVFVIVEVLRNGVDQYAALKQLGSTPTEAMGHA